MIRYRKKPVVVDAAKVSDLIRDARTAWRELPAWFRKAYDDGGVVIFPGGIHLRTLEGTMLANPNDWVIRGVNGEVYPCKPDIFAATYDEVSE